MRTQNVHIVRLVILTAFLMLHVTTHAEVWKQYNVITKHYFSISASGGYYSLLENIPMFQQKVADQEYWALTTRCATTVSGSLWE